MNDNEINIRLQELLLDIKKTPGLFLGKESVTLLSAFLDGFLCSIYYENGKKNYYSFFRGFDQWVAKKYNIVSDHGWSSIIAFFEPAESKAFYKFFELLDEYNNEIVQDNK